MQKLTDEEYTEREKLAYSIEGHIGRLDNLYELTTADLRKIEAFVRTFDK